MEQQRILPAVRAHVTLAERLRASLHARSEARLLTGDLPEERARASVDAAVLIAITDRREPGVTGYIVTPVIGVTPPDLPLTPHEHEVADWFEAPLAFLINPANHKQQTALFQGRQRHYYEIVWSGRRIWGATAAMIVNLSRRLQWP
jgi:hypothetical protein